VDPFVKVVLRWSVVFLIASTLVSVLIHPAAIFPVSWICYVLAGRDAARRGKTWHGIAAGSAITVTQTLGWSALGAPGHADT
jgi:hypothetical protein